MTRLIPPKLLLLLAVLMVAATLAAPGTAIVGGWWRLVGVALIVAGLAIASVASKLFERMGTNIQTFEAPDKLAQSGLFSISRNPMYLGFTLALAGAAIALGSWLALVGPIVFFTTADRWYIPFEERRMQLVFGADYANYRQIVRRWVGRRRRTDLTNPKPRPQESHA